ncbi:equilibrative nucleobase transporter 1-like [Diadema antillarum]|uniref:equilibrative nucleobase transporter 1-like n=1 Tax=Diadema antillarum TaxID=105358 RepID=UPI003A8950B6
MAIFAGQPYTDKPVQGSRYCRARTRTSGDLIACTETRAVHVMKGAVTIERFAAFLLTCCENLIHGGIIFGWPSLVFVLKDVGYFSQACSNTSENDDDFEAPFTTTVTYAATNNYSSGVAGSAPVFCDSQDAQLQLVYSLAVASQSVCMFPMGFFFDRFGTRLSRMLLSALLLLGYLIVGVSSPSTSILLFPGTILFTIGGALLLLSSAQIGNLFVAHKSTVISVVSSMYTASTIVFFLAKILYENGTSIATFFFLLAGSIVILQINTAIFLPRKHIPWPLPENYRLVAYHCQRHVTAPVRPDVVVVKTAATNVYSNDGYIEAEAGELGTKAGNSAGPADCEKRPSLATSRRQQMRRASRVVEDRKRLEYPSVVACVLSAPFFMILVYQCVLELNVKFMYGSLNFILTRLAGGDQSIVSWYTDMFSFSQFLVLFVGPAVGLIIDRNKLQISCRKAGDKPQRTRGPYADVKDTCLSLALGSLSSIGCSACLLIPSLPLQYLTFVFIVLLRSLLFSSGSAAVFSVFPMEHFASVYGAIRTTSGLVGLLQFPIFIIIQHHLHDDPFYVAIGFIAASALTLLLPISLFLMARKKSKRIDRPITPIT